MLVVERQVVADGRREHILANLQHHISHHASGEPLLDEIEGPGRRAQDQHAAGHQQHRARGLVACDHVDAARNQDRAARARQRIGRDGHGDQHHALPVRLEVSQHAPEQFAVAVVAVVCLGVEAVQDKAHVLLPAA